MAASKKMYHPTFGTVRHIPHELVDKWKAQGWRMSPPKGTSGGDVERPSEKQAETPDPQPAPDDTDE